MHTLINSTRTASELTVSHPSTRSTSRSPSPEPTQTSATSAQANSAARNNLQQAAQAQLKAHEKSILQSARGDHLPYRGPIEQRARFLRLMKGYPPLGSGAEADELSDLEEASELRKDHLVRFGERHIVQIGRRRTLHEEDLSNEEDNELRRPGSEAGSQYSDAEGGPGPFVGGHTGHAQAELARRQAQQAELAVAREAAIAIGGSPDGEMGGADVDLDADIEDMDDD
ncbi:hypothetical protein IE53DRAFT_360432 [Violaceomyces palustris]|uniref:Uncharacterized protein n=1 Tax=Violaceomyces palustris TaxID=1673888 RepID=A0ACD0P482_9BASI|nr:hypothetical protein IE53DRAFT_360432 [Violaceomyces palustris]